MKSCQHCGQPIDDSSIFCEHCGGRQAPASAPTQTASPSGQFCPVCGEMITPGLRFCPGCGTSVQAEPARGGRKSNPQPAQNYGGGSYGADNGYGADGGYGGGYTPYKAPTKKKFPIAIVAGAAAAVVVIVALVCVLLFTGGSKEAKFISYQTDLIEDRFLGTATQVNDLYKDGIARDLTITMGSSNKELSKLLEPFTLILNMDVNNKEAVVFAELQMEKDPLLGAAAAYRYESTELSFNVPIMDDKNYVATLSEIDELSDVFDSLNEFDSEKSAKQLQTVLNDLVKIVYDTGLKDSLEVTKGESVELEYLKEDYKCDVYVYEPNEEALEAMFLEMGEYLDSSDDLKDLIDVFTSMDEYSGEDLQDSLDELIDMMLDDPDMMAEEIADTDLVWTVAVDGDTVRLIQVEAYGEVGIAYECAGDLKTGIEEVIWNPEYEDVLLENEFTESKGIREGKLVINPESDWDQYIYTYEFDTQKLSNLGVGYGTYELEMVYDEMTLALEVTEGKGGDDHLISVDNEWEEINIDMSIHSSDKSTAKAPSGKEVDVTRFDDADWEDFGAELSAALEEVLLDHEDDFSELYELLYYGF